MNNNNLSSENPTQDTLEFQGKDAEVLEYILDNLYVVDFAKYISKQKLNVHANETSDEQTGNDHEDTSEAAQENSSSVEQSNTMLKLKINEYKIIAIEALKDLTEEIGMPIADFSGSIQVYTGKRWMKLDEGDLGIFLVRALQKIGIPKMISNDADFINKCVKQLQLFAHVDVHEKENIDYLNFDNGTLHFSNGEFEVRPHTPNDFIKYVLPYKYEPEAECPKFQQFLDRVIPENDKQLVLAEFLGSVFSKLKHEKVLILYGTGANGKSVVLQITTALFGEENVSSHTLEALTDTSGYYRGQLGDSLINYSGEISKKLNSDQFKKLASQEKISCRFPYKRPFTITNYARLAFNCNELPETNDITEGFYRRFLIIPFNVYIPKGERDKELANRIIEDELSGIMNWVLEGLKRLHENNGFSHCESSERILEQYRKHTNTINSFTESEIYKSINMPVKASKLYNKYLEYCEQSELNAVGSKNFYTEIISCGLTKKRRADGSYYDRNVVCGVTSNTNTTEQIKS